MKKLKEPTRIIGVLLICFALISVARRAVYDMEVIGLTPEKCTAETEGTTIDFVYGTKMQYGTRRGHASSVYYDVIEYVVDNQKYVITSRHAYSSAPIIGATTTVYYNPNDPSKAYDNSAPYVDAGEYYYSVMTAIIGLVLVLGLVKKLKRK